MLSPAEEEELKEMWSDWPLSMHSWISSLGSTLFSRWGTRTWPDIQKKLMEHEGLFLAWGSTRINARLYICRCSLCGAIVTAPYGEWDGEAARQNARDKLSLFVLGQKTENSRRS